MILLTGASGFVGQHFLNFISGLSPAKEKPLDFDILPLYNNVQLLHGQQIDLTSLDQVQALFNQYSVTGIVHMAAESRTGVCQQNPEIAQSGNVIPTNNLLNVASVHSAPWFLYVSTDMVFDGHCGNYAADDPVSPLNVYGKSKASAESLVQNYAGPHCIVRPALIYGESIGTRTSSFSWIVNALQSGEGSFFADEIRTPVWVDDLVGLLAKLVQQQATGIIHAGGPEVLSRWEFASKVASSYNLPISLDQKAKLADLSDNTWRPRDLSLISKIAHRMHSFRTLDESLTQIRPNIEIPKT